MARYRAAQAVRKLELNSRTFDQSGRVAGELVIRHVEQFAVVTADAAGIVVDHRDHSALLRLDPVIRLDGNLPGAPSRVVQRSNSSARRGVRHVNEEIPFEIAGSIAN